MNLNFIYVFRIYPDKDTIDFLNMHAGHGRFIWNKFLEKEESSGEFMSFNLMSAYFTNELKIEYPWLSDSNSDSLRYNLWNLDQAIRAYTERKQEKPKFKKRLSSYSIYFKNYKLDKENGYLLLPKLKDKPIKIKLHREFDSPDILKIIKSSTNKFYAVFKCKEYHQPIEYKKAKEISHLGIDLGLTDVITTSDGDSYKAPKLLRKSEANLERKRRAISTKIPGSRRWEKSRIKLARAERKVKNQRSDFNHKLSLAIAGTPKDGVGVETLSLKSMVKNSNLAKSISDAALADLVGMLNYKLKANGKVLTFVSKYFPSSRLCFTCENKTGPRGLASLGTRQWTCSDCGSINHRDINAAKNIAREADSVYKPPYYLRFLKFRGRAFRKLSQI